MKHAINYVNEHFMLIDEKILESEAILGVVE